MATRRRRTTQPLTSAPEAVEPTHEEMLEIAEEREAEEEEVAVEVFLAMAAADTFEALQRAEEEKGLDGFFDPDFYKQEVRHPAPEQPAPPVVHVQPVEPRPRYIPRNNTRRRKG
jgi:hypothetical protein